jgi:hypothetical protein
MSGECVEASRACLSRMVVGEGKGGIEADEGHSSANGSVCSQILCEVGHEALQTGAVDGPDVAAT